SLGTLFLHEQHVLHRDIKSANVFLSKSGVVKIGDLGISKLLAGKDSLAKTAIGTPYYLCPEMWQNKPYNNKSDVWSLGIVLYEMTTLNKPFQGNSMNQLHKRVSSGKYEPISNFFSNDLASVIKKILVLDPKYRPTMKEIMDMPEVTRHLYVLPGFRKFGYGNANNGDNSREQISQNYESGINKQDNNIGNIHSRRRRSKSSPPVNYHDDELDNQEDNSQQDNEMIEMIQKVPQSVLYPEVKPQFHLAFPLQLKYRSQRKDLVLPAPRYQETQQLRNQYSNSPSTESMPPTSFPLNSTQDSISKVSLYSVLSAVVPGSKLIHGYDTHHDRINTERAKQLPPIRKSNDQKENEKQNKKENSNQIHQVADTERKSVQQFDSQKKPHLPLRVPLPLPIHPLAKQQQQQQLQKPQPKEPQIRQQILKPTYNEQIIKQPKHGQQSKIQPGMRLPPIDRNQQQTPREEQKFS
ncbi:MAG: putative NEK protein kinase, partial [Streblomastix strix]